MAAPAHIDRLVGKEVRLFFSHREPVDVKVTGVTELHLAGGATDPIDGYHDHLLYVPWSSIDIVEVFRGH
jgi:hypothetical protein